VPKAAGNSTPNPGKPELKIDEFVKNPNSSRVWCFVFGIW